MTDPLLMIPGLMCDGRVFENQVNDLSRDIPIHLAALGCYDSVRETALAILEAAPRRFALMGHSFGGILAMEVMRHGADRVSRLALLSTTPLAETPSQAAWREPMIAQAKSGALLEAVANTLPAENLAPGPSRGVIQALMRQMAADIGPETFVAQSRALQRRRDAQKVLLSVKVPTLIVVGAHDRVTPVKRAEAMAQLVPGAELLVLDEAGHMPMQETPEKLNAALRRWLDLPARNG